MMAVVVGTTEQLVENLANANDESYWNGNETVNPTISPDGSYKHVYLHIYIYNI